MSRAPILLAAFCAAICMAGCADTMAEAETETAPATAPVSSPVPEPNEVLPRGNSPEDFEALLGEYLAMNQRLENVAFKVLRANTPSCPEIRRDAGFKAHTIYDYPSELQMYARVYLKLDTQPTIRVVAEASPADQAGLESGDRIISLGNFNIPDGSTAGQLFQALSQREFQNTVSPMRIERSGQAKDLNLSPINVCGYPAQLFYSELVNAHTDGEEIWVTSELLRQVDNDTSLALILAHELAHATQDHLRQEPSKLLELEADRLSLIYLEKAGYDPALAVELWTANPLNHEPDQAGTHPSPEERLQILTDTLKNL